MAMAWPGDGLSTFLKLLKLGESALDKDSGVPIELNDPGSEVPEMVMLT